MADLTAQLIANSYRNLLQAPGTGGGIGSGQSVTVEDGAGVPSGLALSTNGVGLSGNITIQGSLFTGTGAQLNTAVANAGTLVNGIVAQNGAQSFGRTFVGTAGVTITNANGGAGNPTFALVNTSVSAGTYAGGSNTFTIDAQGRVTDVTAKTTISANAFIGGTFSGSSLYVENNVSVSGSLNVAGAVNVSGAVHINGATSINNDLDITGTFTANGPAIVKNITASVVSASYLYGDGSNITGLAGAGTMTALTAGTGIHIIENGTTVTGITGSGTVAINADQSFGTVSATSFIIGGDNVAMSATVATLSATMATSIDNSNIAIAAVSALTSVNAANITTNINAITSVNSVITALSGTLATSISNATGNITALSATMATSIDNTNTNLTALSATMATSIGNTNTLIAATSLALATSIGNTNSNVTTNINAITSINSILGDGTGFATDAELAAVSVALATSIGNTNTLIAATSLALATSIGNSNTNITTNTNAITSINAVLGDGTGFATDAELAAVSATLATSISNHLPLSGGTLTGTVSRGNNIKAQFGNSNDLEIYHDGSNGYVVNNAGNLILDDRGGGGVTIKYNTETMANFSPDGAASLYYDNAIKLATTTYGISVTGNAICATETANKTGSVTANLSSYQNFVWTLTGNITLLANPTTEVVGMSGVFIFIQNSTGGYTVSLDSDWKTAGGAGLTLSAAANAVDIVPYFVQSTNNILLGTPMLAFS